MKPELKFFKKEDGTILIKVKTSGEDCAHAKPLVANTTDGASEKHVPVATVEGNRVIVNVGSVDHPMLEEHWIEFVVLETERGYSIAYLNPGEKPHVEFLTEDKPVAVYEYCNLHGLWKTEL